MIWIDEGDFDEMVKEMVGHLDYDLGKQLDATTAEDPDEVNELLAELVAIAQKYNFNDGS